MGDRVVCVAIKPVAPVLEVDWTTGIARLDPRHLVRTPSDAAACAVGRAVADALGADVVVVAVAGSASEGVLLDAAAEVGGAAVRVEVGEDADAANPAEQWGSDVVAVALEAVARDAAVVVCGDASGDRGSGTVPARLAHRLGVPQALCLRAVRVEDERLHGTRRLEGGRREHVALDLPCVVSVEAAAAAPHRAALGAALAAAAGHPGVERRRLDPPHGAVRGDAPGTVVGPYRPRASDLPAPDAADPVRRAVEIAGSLVAGDPPEVVRASPEDAADAILERLARWGLR